jgi:hypothetical protein
MADVELFAFGGNTEAFAVTITTGRMGLDGSTAQEGKVVRIFNDGTVPVFVAPGGSTVNAVIPVSGGATGAMPIAPGRETGFTLAGGQTHLAFITASGTATVYVTQGRGI